MQRLKPPLWRAAPAAAKFGVLYRNNPDRAQHLAMVNARLIAEDLHDVGIDVNCAPVLDLRESDGHGAIGDRSFADEPKSVAALGQAWITGLGTGGVVPVIKHIPGHGRARVDSHHALPVIDVPLRDLERRDFVPFRALNSAPAAMTGHLLFSAIDATHPVTVSAAVIKTVVRDMIGFDGLLISDDLSMSALSGSLAGRAAGAITAGCDIALHCSGVMSEMMAMIDRIPMLSGTSRRRATEMLGVAARLAAERSDLDRDRALHDLEAGLAEA